jgi:hypothetical protein
VSLGRSKFARSGSPDPDLERVWQPEVARNPLGAMLNLLSLDTIHEQIGTAEILGAVRLGIGPFNTEAHIQASIEAASETAASARR